MWLDHSSLPLPPALLQFFPPLLALVHFLWAVVVAGGGGKLKIVSSHLWIEPKAFGFNFFNFWLIPSVSFSDFLFSFLVSFDLAYALELFTFGTIVGVNPSVVQWMGLTLGEPPSWSWFAPEPSFRFYTCCALSPFVCHYCQLSNFTFLWTIYFSASDWPSFLVWPYFVLAFLVCATGQCVTYISSIWDDHKTTILWTIYFFGLHSAPCEAHQPLPPLRSYSLRPPLRSSARNPPVGWA